MNLIDLTSKSPATYRLRTRPPEAVTTIICHQMGVGAGLWRDDSPSWAKVAAHYVVRQDGSVLKLHDPTVRMKVGSGVANEHGITIEFAGSYRSDRGLWYKPEKFGADKLADYPAQVCAGRALLSQLVMEYPSIKAIAAHRHIEGKTRGNCCGPELWFSLGEWAKGTLGLVEVKPLPSGLPLPDSWRRPLA